MSNYYYIVSKIMTFTSPPDLGHSSGSPNSGQARVRPVAFAAGTKTINPFVPMSDTARIAVIAIYTILIAVPEVSSTIIYYSTSAEFYALLLINASFFVLTILPLVVKRLFGAPTGWLHPLVIPIILGVADSIIRNPFSLVMPWLSWNESPTLVNHVFLHTHREAVQLSIHLQMRSLALLGLIGYYVGFSFLRTRLSPLKHNKKLIHTSRVIFVYLVCVTVFFYIIYRSGGLVSHMSEFAAGRFHLREGIGHITAFVTFAPYALLLLYTAKPNVLSKSWFIGLFGLSVIMQFIVSGSRSAMFTPVAVLLGIWMLINRRPPAIRALLIMILAFLLIGVLGEVRNSAQRGGVVDFSALTEFSVMRAAQSTLKEIRSRDNNSADPAIYLFVPDSVAHLHGVTYVAAALFIVPRVVWPEKPRGAGAHVAAMIFGDWDTGSGYEGGGIPPSGVGEAYWNFGVPGVLGIYLIFGLFHRTITNRFMNRQNDPYIVLFYFMIIIVFSTPTTIAAVAVLQLGSLLWITRVINRSRFVSGRTTRS